VRVLLTGYADPSAVEGSINIGEVFRFLSKPCPPRVLRETLSLAIEASRTTPATAQEAAVQEAAAPVPETPAASQPDVIRDDDETQPSMLALNEEQVAAANDRSSSHWETVTSVVMSEDSSEESQEVVSLGSPMLSTADVGVVIFTIDSDFAAAVIRAVSTERDTILATKLSKVAQVLEQRDAGVLITDYTTNNAMFKKIIAALKQRLPQLVTIVVSEGRDTTDMINLINFGQVYRYVLKPVDPAKLKHDINAAVMHHLYLLSNPESTKRHQVNAESVQPPASSTTVNRFLDRLNNLPAPGKDPADTSY
jgi:DNA-binding NarL/FixJ family response regulator